MLAWITESASGAYALQIAAAVGELQLADVPAWALVLLAVLLALAVLVTFSWQQFRSRSRWQAALDAYAEREIIRQKHRITLKEMQPAPTAFRISSGAADHANSSQRRAGSKRQKAHKPRENATIQ